MVPMGRPKPQWEATRHPPDACCPGDVYQSVKFCSSKPTLAPCLRRDKGQEMSRWQCKKEKSKAKTLQREEWPFRYLSCLSVHWRFALEILRKARRIPVEIAVFRRTRELSTGKPTPHSNCTAVRRYMAYAELLLICRDGINSNRLRPPVTAACAGRIATS